VPERRILVIGSGGREHALAWRLARDPESTEVLVGPGNDAMARSFRRLELDPLDPNAVARACRESEVDLVVVGPEAPLAAGLVDALEAREVAVFGPSHAAARLEASKSFAKEVMHTAGVPTARSESFVRSGPACEALDRFDPPWVIKADGLAAGKGVCLTADRAEAVAFLEACLDGGRFGESGQRVLIEEFLQGEEASVMAICDGTDFVLLPAARDYKRALDGDQGPNTGGMGAWAPAPRIDAALERVVGERIVRPVLAAMRARGAPFLGTLYCGLMLGPEVPFVVEFNVRFGDPEAQVILPLLDGDLGGLLGSAALGSVEPDLVRRRPETAVAVALVGEGYPDAPQAGGVIEGLDGLGDEVMVFHAGTRAAGEGRWEIAGGRAAYVMAKDAVPGVARERAYAAVARLRGRGFRFRRDIAAEVAPAAAHSTVPGRVQ
jgi:phosphoribosylamine--glycine ligase